MVAHFSKALLILLNLIIHESTFCVIMKVGVVSRVPRPAIDAAAVEVIGSERESSAGSRL